MSAPSSRSRRRARGLVGFACALLLGGAGSAGAAFERPEIEIGWIDTPPVLDGRLTPGEWAGAAYVPELTQATPDPGAPATQRTEIWIATDGEHLYIAARLWDDAPERIVRNVMRRDENTSRDDRFGFTLDPFLDRQNGYFFQTNANGVRRDSLLEGGRSEESWDGRWSVATSIDARGWTLEIALPFATINFDPEADVWGLNMARGIRRRDEIDRWSDPVRERFLVAMGRAGNLKGMRGVRQGLGIQAIPSLTVRRVDDANPPPQTRDLEERHYTRLDPSLDLFWKATPSVTAALTLNTDFGETEVDERRVNLSRFALFFPEKRDFFLQDALIFEFGDLDENGRPFFSRRIGLDESGTPVKILGGGKATGRVGPIKFGLLDVVLDEQRGVDQTNLLVARASANVGESTFGAILTHGDPEANGENVLGGLDLNFRDTDFGRGQTLEGQLWAQATWNDPDDGPSADPGAVVGAGWAWGARIAFPNDRHNWEVLAREIDDDFDPALGFVNRVGIRRGLARYRRRWRPPTPGILLIDSEWTGEVFTEQGRQVRTGRGTWRVFEIQNPVNDTIRFEYEHRYEAVERPFSSFTVRPGRYHFDEARLRLAGSENRKLSGSLDLGWGSFFDGTRTAVEASIDLRPIRHLQLGLTYDFDDLRLPAGDVAIHVVRGQASLFFTPNISWSTLVQWDSVNDSIGINSRFRWIVEDGRELFLVLNQGFETRDEVRPTRSAPLVKLQWTFWL